MDENHKYLRVDVSGENEGRWKKFRSALLEKLMSFMEKELDPVKHTTIREEAAQFTHKLLEYGKAKLDKAGINNDKTLAEIEELYSQRLKNLAEARKLNAEAEEIELKNQYSKLKLLITSAKIFISGNKDEETALFIKDIDQFLLTMKALEQNDTGVVE